MIGQANNALIVPGLGLAVAQAATADGPARARLEGDARAAVRHLMREPDYRPVRPG